MSTHLEDQFTKHVFDYTLARKEKNEEAMNRVKFEIRILLLIPTYAQALLIFISSLRPGTGASTARNLLAEVLGFEEPNEVSAKRLQRDAGKYRRFVAELWKFWRSKTHVKRNAEGLAQFQEWLEKNPTAFEEIAEHFRIFDEATLREFYSDLAQFVPSDERDFWTRIPDEKMWTHIVNERNPGGVYTGKLTGIIDYITGDHENAKMWGIPIIRFLLDVDPEVGGARVVQRDMEEGRIDSYPSQSEEFASEVAKKVIENQQRMDQDWVEYFALYGITPDEFEREEYGMEKMPTSDLVPEEVVGHMLYVIYRSLSGELSDKQTA